MNVRERLLKKLVRRYGGQAKITKLIYLTPTDRMKIYQIIGVPVFNMEELPKFVAPKPHFATPWTEPRRFLKER